MNLRKDLVDILARDPRFSIPAYQFVMDALDGLEAARRRERKFARRRAKGKAPLPKGWQQPVTGPMLCKAVRDLALRQFGLMAKTVLNYWGVRSTSDIGEIVYHLIAVGDLQASEGDRREDFDDVYDFDEAFTRAELAINSVDGVDG